MKLKYTEHLQTMEHPVIFRNALMTPDGTILHSEHRWDCKQYTDTKTGEWFLVDGGNDYIRKGGSRNYTSLTVTTDSPHEEIRQVFQWTSSLDKDGNAIPPVRRKLCELDDGHIIALVDWTKDSYPKHIHWIMCNEAEYRGLTIEENYND